MAKDAKGHGSDARGGSGPASYQNVSTKPLVSNATRDRLAAERSNPNGVASTFSSKGGVGVHGKGMYATLNSGAMVKLNAAATGGRIPGIGSTLDPSQHTMVRPSGDVSHLSGSDARFSPGPNGTQVFDRAAPVARKKSRPT